MSLVLFYFRKLIQIDDVSVYQKNTHFQNYSNNHTNTYKTNHEFVLCRVAYTVKMFCKSQKKKSTRRLFSDIKSGAELNRKSDCAVVEQTVFFTSSKCCQIKWYRKRVEKNK